MNLWRVEDVNHPVITRRWHLDDPLTFTLSLAWCKLDGSLITQVYVHNCQHIEHPASMNRWSRAFLMWSYMVCYQSHHNVTPIGSTLYFLVQISNKKRKTYSWQAFCPFSMYVAPWYIISNIHSKFIRQAQKLILYTVLSSSPLTMGKVTRINCRSNSANG